MPAPGLEGNMVFSFARKLQGQHLIVQPSDLALNPPESYLYIQDGLIVSCGVLYTLCYFFYMVRTYRDKHIAGPVEYLCGTMAYELYYAQVITSTSFERGCFFIWFLMDVAFATVALISAYSPKQRLPKIRNLIIGVVAGVVFLHWLCQVFPDEREQVTAYWTGWLLQLPIGWGELYLLLDAGDTRGQSLETWYVQLRV